MSEIAVMEFEIVGGAVDPFPLGTREPSEIYEKKHSYDVHSEGKVFDLLPNNYLIICNYDWYEKVTAVSHESANFSIKLAYNVEFKKNVTKFQSNYKVNFDVYWNAWICLLRFLLSSTVAWSKKLPIGNIVFKNHTFIHESTVFTYCYIKCSIIIIW